MVAHEALEGLARSVNAGAAEGAVDGRLAFFVFVEAFGEACVADDVAAGEDAEEVVWWLEGSLAVEADGLCLGVLVVMELYGLW